METNDLKCPYCNAEVTAEMQFCPSCGKNLAGAPPSTKDEKSGGKSDTFLMLIGIISFAHFFFYMILRFAEMYQVYQVLNYTLGLALYAIPLLASFGMQKKGPKTLIMIFGIVSLVIYIINQITPMMYY
ncbi:MAG: hypothetical protein C0594_04110 [Marinilabiliales bacterium]|nr:MAG: hypothetical protein C0594_04110 [Marinilabiliales bacterium]